MVTKVGKAFRKTVLHGIAMLCLAGPFAAAAENQKPSNDDKADAGDIIIPDSASNHPADKAIPLTSGEVELVRTVFGDKIDTKYLRKYFLGKAFEYKSNNGKTWLWAITCADHKSIEFYGTYMQCNDFSKSVLPTPFAIFMHEMLHIYQAQNNLPMNRDNSKYEYTLDKQSKFSDYGTEQQGALMEDYAKFFLHPVHLNYSAYVGGEQTPEHMELLAKVIETEFPGARTIRLALEAKELNKTKSLPAAPAPNLR